MTDSADTCEPQQPDKRPRSYGLIIAQAALVAALAVWVLVLRLNLGWGDEWVIRVHPPYRLSSLLPAVVLLLGVGGLAGYLWKLMRREPGERARRMLAWAVAVTLAAGAWLLQIGLWSCVPAHIPMLAAVQLSHVSTGYLEEAYRIQDLDRYLREYARDMPTKVEHVATHPPGAVLFFYAVRRAGEVMPGLNDLALTVTTTASGMSLQQIAEAIPHYPPAIWRGERQFATAMLASWLLGALGCLMVPLLFAATRRVLGQERALAAAAVMALAPSMLFYFPLLDQLIALLGVLMLAALVATPRHWAWGGAAGLAAAAALFVSLGALALVALGTVFLLMRAIKHRGGQPDFSWTQRYGGFTALAAFGVGLLVGLTLWRVAGIDTSGVFTTGLTEHSSITGRASMRTHGVWVWLNLIEFSVFLGLPLAVVIAASVPGIMRDLRRKAGQILPAYLGASALLTLLVLDVSGVVRGETGRLWLLFVPYLAASAAPRLLRENGSGQGVLIATCALTAVQLLLMALTMQPIVRPY